MTGDACICKFVFQFFKSVLDSGNTFNCNDLSYVILLDPEVQIARLTEGCRQCASGKSSYRILENEYEQCAHAECQKDRNESLGCA